MDGIASPGSDLCISITFLTGHYHGEEWPPSPARLFQALLAAVMTCGYQEFVPLVEPALRWLENQPPPRIRACSAEELGAYRIAVPNNDMDVVAWDWQQGRHKDMAVLKTMKQVRPWCVSELGPHLQYLWTTGSGQPAPPVEALRTASRLLHTLGWGVDMAYADVLGENPDGVLYEPAVSGRKRLATAMPGTLDDLRETYQRFQVRNAGKGVDSSTRPSLLASQPYRRAGEEFRPVACFRLLTKDATKFKKVRWEDARKVAAWLRHRTAEELRNEYNDELIATYVQGHVDSAEGDRSRRLSYVPLPSIYGKPPDGLIRRAMIVEPAGMPGDVSDVISRKLVGAILTGSDGQEECCLAPPEPGDWTFRQYLRPDGARVWRSVTPVVLHGHNTTSRGVISVGKTERLLLRAFAMAGFREEQIEGLAFQTGPLWNGTKHAAAMRTPEHLNGYPRVHVEVRFSSAVSGPLLAGIGRHYGIGLFAAVA